MLQLTDENYYSTEADKDYMSASQFKSFRKCEAETMAELKGLYTPPDSRALIVGGYMDALWDEEELDTYKFLHHKDLYTKTGAKRADIQAADNAFRRAASDPVFCQYMDGQKQKIVTGEIEGVPFKGKLDSYIEDEAIVDLKYMKDMNPVWNGSEKVTFIDAFGYDLQLAIYRELIKQETGVILPTFIACITKQDEPEIRIIEVPDWKCNSALEIVKHFAPLYQEIKEGLRVPKRCEKCDYCRSTYKIEKPISYEDLLIA